jgi:hypothetical protein
MGEKRSGWFYVFVSCGVLLLAGAIVIGVGTVMTVRWAKDVKDELEDPVARTNQAKELLATEELPAGYQASMHVRLPFGLGRMLALTDGEKVSPSDPLSNGEHVFFYLEGPGWDEDWKAFAAGGDPPFDNLDALNINVDSRERIATGELKVGAMELFYAANRGEISGEGFHADDGVFSIVLVRCPNGDEHSRTILWAGPAADEGSEDPVAGTTADPARIAEMMGHFELCAGAAEAAQSSP